MRNRPHYFLLLLVVILTMLLSCQKEIDGSIESGGSITPVNQKPKVGTKWIYRYYVYYSSGGLATSKVLTYQAKDEQTINGETWLNVVDIENDTTVYLLNEKADGLYQYTNNNPYLFCKDPAVVNDSYSTFLDLNPESFIVKGVGDTLATGVGNVPVNYYEGYIGVNRIDLTWYNKYAWVVRTTKYRKFPLGTVYYKYTARFIDSIIY